MSAYEEKTPSLEWKPLPDDLTTSLPFEATLAVVDDEGQPLTELREQVSVSAITSKVCLAEGFEKESMGLWSPAFLPGHYEHGFDTEVCAPDGSTSSLYLKGGNDSNFGMTLRLPAPAAGADDDGGGGPAEPPRPLPEDAESEDPSAFDGAFKPQSVAFYVRTDHGRADAGHFILGESNEVNKRVAQFQFTKDGKMGLLGTQGVTHGATPYVAHKWYHVELRFDWEKREVAFFVDSVLQKRHIPFRRDTSSFIGACALGNRDKCTTWFDSITFVQEVTLFRRDFFASGGEVRAWVGPLREETSRDGFYLRAEAGSGHVSTTAHHWPRGRHEGAQRVAINGAALRDFASLLADASGSDVTFLVEGRELHAHRCVLMARSEAFRVMFSSNMREGSKEGARQVPVHEVTHDAFRCMLHFLYGGAVTVPEDLAVELLGLADRYLLNDLKLLCGFTLARMISVETVCRIVQAADRWDARDSQLRAQCIEFIVENYKEVVSSATYDELTTSPQILLDIAKAVAPSVKKGKNPSPAASSYTPPSKRPKLGSR